MLNNPEQLLERRIPAPEADFVERFPDAREATVYEFESETEGEAARILLLSTAFKVGRHGRVQRVPWKGKTRVIAST